MPRRWCRSNRAPTWVGRPWVPPGYVPGPPSVMISSVAACKPAPPAPAKPSASMLTYPAPEQRGCIPLVHVSRASAATVRRMPEKSRTRGRRAGRGGGCESPAPSAMLLLGALAQEFGNPRIGAGANQSSICAVGPGEKCPGDLVVVTAIGEARQLVRILREPRCSVGHWRKKGPGRADCGR
jgi:hypothetical protein